MLKIYSRDGRNIIGEEEEERRRVIRRSVTDEAILRQNDPLLLTEKGRKAEVERSGEMTGRFCPAPATKGAKRM